MLDMMPPSAVDAERALLGAVLINPGVMDEVLSTLGTSGEVFFDGRHRALWEAYVGLHRAGRGIDSVTVLGTGVDFEGVGSYLAELTSAVPTSAHASAYADVVIAAWTRRAIVEVCQAGARGALQEGADAGELVRRLEGEVFRLGRAGGGGTHLAPAGSWLDDAMVGLQTAAKNHGVTGIRSGIEGLDRLVGGWKPGEVIVLAARPSVGKTALALCFAGAAAVQEGKGVAFFSLEMTSQKLGERLLMQRAGVSLDSLRFGVGRMQLEALARAQAELSESRLSVCDRFGLSAWELRTEVRRAVSRGNCDLVVVDYLQLLRHGGKSESRQVEVAEISRELKTCAGECGVPVIALSQLSRAPGEGPAELHHLRESGAIEQDADVVIMIERTKEQSPQGPILELAVKKHRNGPTGAVRVVFQRATQRVFGVARDDEPGEDDGPHYECRGERFQPRVEPMQAAIDELYGDDEAF